jgi:pyridoxine kinase
VLSGYLGDAEQAQDVARLVGAVRAANPDALYVCDPVIGDAGGLYVPEALAEAILEHLIPAADIATPNVHELAWLSGAPIGDSGSMTAAAETLGPARVLVTSALAMMAGSTGNLLVSGGQSVMAEHRHIPNAPNGLGDLMSATFLARLLEGVPEEKALQMATGSVFEILARTSRRGADELTLETDAQSLRTPMAMVNMRRVMSMAGRKKP